MNFWTRASVWMKVKDSINAVGAVTQVVLIAGDSQHIWNYLTAAVQLLGTFITIWFEDKNRNDVPDIFEKEIVTIVKSESPITVETKTETNDTPKVNEV